MTKKAENSTDKSQVAAFTLDVDQESANSESKKQADGQVDDKPLAQSGRKGGLTSDDTAFG
ncbi:hypothetical protein [Undibacterium luofuense]|uniref:Uncharacterized protein n=1 Tax=Undibacterium luofuense TaxID=2828733 RepID=A0A941DP84_9BURK|nr:hypothetical protein [Undibacterium luofuense]MBR7783674.1 hypothetical protein [Undibacterium luofuense]